MAGSPIKHERNRLFREALLQTLTSGGKEDDLVKALQEITAPQIAAAKAGDLRAAEFIADRIDGKPAQQMQIASHDGGAFVLKREDEAA